MLLCRDKRAEIFAAELILLATSDEGSAYRGAIIRRCCSGDTWPKSRRSGNVRRMSQSVGPMSRCGIFTSRLAEPGVRASTMVAPIIDFELGENARNVIAHRFRASSIARDLRVVASLCDSSTRSAGFARRQCGERRNHRGGRRKKRAQLSTPPSFDLQLCSHSST